MSLIYWAILQGVYLDLYSDFKWLGKTHFSYPNMPVTSFSKYLKFKMLFTLIALEKQTESKQF